MNSSLPILILVLVLACLAGWWIRELEEAVKRRRRRRQLAAHPANRHPVPPSRRARPTTRKGSRHGR